MKRPHLVIRSSREKTRLLLRLGNRELLRAALPPTPAHPEAARILLEALSLWIGRPVCVVLVADASGDSSALGLCDGFGFGNETLHYAVEVIERGGRLQGMGSFRDLQLNLWTGQS
jgi:hypothetical protein